jgi:hypothetical protein
MLEVKMTAEMLDRNIAGLETAITLLQKRIAETHSGIDKFMLESFIIETREVLAVLELSKPQTASVPFTYATQPEG